MIQTSPEGILGISSLLGHAVVKVSSIRSTKYTVNINSAFYMTQFFTRVQSIPGGNSTRQRGWMGGN